ncbi:MAG: GspH/FimT family pseudopilin [Pseudomonadota bacterium]
MLSKKQSGFTLIEMMIVIGILVVIATIAIPSFMSLLPGMRLNGAARQVMGDLMAARMKAVKLNKNTQVFFDSNGYQYKICNDDADSGTTVYDGEGDVENRNIQTNYHDVSFSSNVNPSFSPRGTANSWGTITLTNSESKQKKVVVLITGRIKIEDV